MWKARAMMGGIALVAAGYLQTAQAQSVPTRLPPNSSTYRAVLDRYCVTCHNEKLKTAGLMLDQMDVENVPPGAPVWEKVIHKLRTGEMPPAGMPRPDHATYNA